MSRSAAAKSPEELELPFGLSMAPNTRVVLFAQYMVGDIEEINGSLATTGTAKDVIAFYEEALTSLGFRIFSKTNRADRISIAAKRGKGDFFSISSSTKVYEIEANEVGMRITIRIAPTP